MSIFHPAEDKFTQMTQTPIPNLVATLAVPTIISMLVTSVYNMADTYFVGQIGTSATAAVGVALPLMAVIQAIGFTFGQGSGNTVSRLLGQQKREEAESMISVAFFSAFLCGLVLGVLGTVLIEPMVHFLGATDTSAKMKMGSSTMLTMAPEKMPTMPNTALPWKRNWLFSTREDTMKGAPMRIKWT